MEIANDDEGYQNANEPNEYYNQDIDNTCVEELNGIVSRMEEDFPNLFCNFKSSDFSMDDAIRLTGGSKGRF